MTLKEKVSPMKDVAPPVERLGIPAYNWRNEALHGVSRRATCAWASLIVWKVREGRDAAAAIDRHLRQIATAGATARRSAAVSA